MLQQHKLVHKFWLILILLLAFLLRVYHLHTLPNGLFIDEAARGYDAFSITRTGADMFGEFLPLFPRGFDDYTPALYTYLTVPFVYLLGLSRFSTRYAAVWIGVFTVAAAYLAIRKPFGRRAGLIGAALLAISPWYLLLSRIGTEWTLLGLGPMLTIVVLYRGLSRPSWLVAAGVVGGLSLYGYAPVKAFLPLLLAAFILFYHRRLWAQKRAALAALTIFTVFAYPVYAFSFTPEGQIRFKEVSYFDKLPLVESLYLFGANYLAYFDPRFLLIPSSKQIFVHSLRDVGLFYWFELPLIALGIVYVLRSGRREQYFWLVWLLLAPLGINLHTSSPSPGLWLTSTPTLHGLAAAGLAYLLHLSTSPHRLSWQRTLGIIFLGCLGLMAVWNIRKMIVDLFIEFPVYSVLTEQNWWAYGMERAMVDVDQLNHAFDSIILQPFELDATTYVSGIYFAFYNRFSPEQRHSEVRTYGGNAWQFVGPVNIGQLETRILQPGCHLAVTTANKRYALPLPNHLLKTYTLGDKEFNPIALVAVAGGQPPQGQPVQAIFGEQILLESFAFVSNKSNVSLLVEPGQALCLVLNWQSAGNLAADYTVFVHFAGPINPSTGGPLWTQHDGMPVDGLRPTTSWQPGEIIRDMRVVFVPLDAPKATYQLNVGLYHPATGERLPVRDQAGQQGDQLTLLELQVD
jgi:4-amino-4-deoxy-L-arabinose transferase-like glycosyltransferase